MEISPYLNFDGTCADAFRLYHRVLGGTIAIMQTHGESPMKEQVPPGWRDRILHVRLEFANGFALMGSDAPPDHFAPAQGMSVSINVPVAEGERIFRELSDGGQVAMPFQKTFWAAGFGMFVDRFGTPWMINSEK